VKAFGPDGLNRRRAPRVPMGAAATVSIVGGRVVNASVYGMLIESPVPLEHEAVLRLRLVVAGQKADVETRVAACTPAPADRRGFGIGLEFTAVPEDVRERLVRTLAELALWAPRPARSREARSPGARSAR
jgi:hypothetical protein